VIPWWKTTFGEEEIERVVNSIRSKNISQGKITEQFEAELSDFLGVKYTVATSSGSTALLLSLMAIGIKPGDEVIVPNRTWIATAHAPFLLGAKVVLVDVEKDRPILDISKIEELISPKTKAIIPVHMNGRSVPMAELNKIAKKNNLAVIEDAAQAFGSRNEFGYLGTQSDIGCFSLSVAKIIATGQGGFAVTNDPEIAVKLRAIRTHGVENVKDPEIWGMPGFNFRFTDVLASIGLEQLKRMPERIEKLIEIYKIYSSASDNGEISLIPVDYEKGEIPLYTEVLVPNRSEFMNHLLQNNIDSRPFYPSLNSASYLEQNHSSFYNSDVYAEQGIYLPSGPSQNLTDIVNVVEVIKSLNFQDRNLK